ncbi:MAG: murE [Acidobacteria bacterium]|nr:murE [Acidobacteriota bacterium]
MTLGELLDRVAAIVPLDGATVVGGDARSRAVTAVAYDSRTVRPGAVFFALRGHHLDGASYARQAADRGALAIVAESARPADVEVPWVTVANARLVLAAAASTFFDHPSHDLLVAGVTGTNGKTTCAYLLASIFDAAGLPSGRIGTTGYRIGQTERDLARTTPESPDVQALLREMVRSGAGACVMEVSSHALALHRADYVRFGAGIFTNLTRDHLDFHSGMEDYFLAKRRLFELLPEDAPAIINIDDPYGARLAADRPCVTYGINRPADVATGSVVASVEGLQFEVRTPRGLLHIQSPLTGRGNAYNLLAAAATAVALDIPFGAIERGLASVQRVPGRFEVVSGHGDDVTVVIDYAHTDDALRNVLETARPMVRGRLVTVFGCGGDRDRTKRPLMGAVAARLSDLVVITSDNPRSEDPAQIIEEIKRGLVPPDRPSVRDGQPVAPVRATAWQAIVDRREAIEAAIRSAQPGDFVLIAGKGHERYQEIGGKVLPFDDAEVARDALAKRRAHAGAGNLS